MISREFIESRLDTRDFIERFVDVAQALASERHSVLIATFIEDQLAVRPPISQAEIDDLKHRLGLAGPADE